MNKELLKEKSWEILKSKWFLFLIFSVLTIVLIVNLLFFSLSESYYISSPWFNNNKITIDIKYSWMGYFSISISYLGSLFGTIGALYAVLKKRSFIYYLTFGLICTVIDSLITGLFFTSFISLAIIVLAMINYGDWKDKTKEKELTKNKTIFLFTLFFIFIIFWSLINYFIFAKYTSYQVRYLDIFASALALLGWYFLMKKSKIGFLLFGINDLIYLSLFFIVGLYVSAASFILYLTINILSFNTYEEGYKEREENN